MTSVRVSPSAWATTHQPEVLQTTKERCTSAAEEKHVDDDDVYYNSYMKFLVKKKLGKLKTELLQAVFAF